MLWGLRGCRRTPPQQKRRALGSLARSPREPPCTPHSRFEDVVGSAPRAPPPGDPPARAAGIPVPRLRRAFGGFPAPRRASPDRRPPRHIVAVGPRVPPRAGSGAGRFADGGRGGPSPQHLAELRSQVTSRGGGGGGAGR